MRGFATLVGLVLALAGGYFVYQNSIRQHDFGDSPPQHQIDVVGVESALRSMANAERQFLATHGRYGTLDDLEREGLLQGGTERRGYRFTADAEGSRSFSIVAEPVDPDKAEWPTLVIDESMEITQQ
jgi:hypothetical protein